MFLPYESEKWAGFYFSNAKVKFTKQDIKIDFKTGKFKDVEVNNPKFAGGKGTKKQEIVAHYTYHPFYPVYIKNVETQDTLITFNSIIPAFMLYANEDKAFWHNFVKTGEYILDVATTFSGIGNLAKFRHLVKLGKARSIIAKVKLGAGIVEVTSGTTNLLLKLTNVADSELGQAISEYLFWLELLSLSGELTVAIKGGLRKSADDLLKYEDEIIERANREGVEDVDGLIDELDYLKDSGIKVVGPGGKGYLGGQRLGRAQIRVWIKYIDEISEGRASLKIVEEGDTLYKKLELENAQAGFDPDKLQIVIKKGFTEFEIFHEVKHLEECLKLGKDEYIKGMAKYGGSWDENLLRTYKRELYVYRRVIENRFKFNKAEQDNIKYRRKIKN